MRNRVRSRDDGMSLIEVLVSMVVFSMAIGIAFTAVIIVMQKSGDAQKSAAAIAELRLALAQIDRQVRSGNVLYSPENEVGSGCESRAGTNAGTCMRIYTQSNGDHKCVQWQMFADTSAGEDIYILRTRSWALDWQMTGAVEPWSVVARDLYLDVDDTSVQLPFLLEGAATVYSDRMLRVHLQAWDARRGVPMAVDSAITGRNTSYGYDQGQCTQVPPA